MPTLLLLFGVMFCLGGAFGQLGSLVIGYQAGVSAAGVTYG